jgi:hypothetical protein
MKRDIDPTELRKGDAFKVMNSRTHWVIDKLGQRGTTDPYLEMFRDPPVTGKGDRHWSRHSYAALRSDVELVRGYWPKEGGIEF